MKINYNSVLYETAIVAFEQLCFMFHAPELENTEKDFHIGAVAMVGFTGQINGKLYLKVCQDLLPAVASNMLGEDQPTLQNQKDALGEMTNVVCGNVLSKIAQNNESFYISAPQVFDTEILTEKEKESCLANVYIPLDEGYVDLMLFLDQKQ